VGHEAGVGFRIDSDPDPVRGVVDEEGKGGGVGDALVKLDEALLGGFDEERREHNGGVASEIAEETGPSDGLIDVVGAGVGHDLAFAAGFLDDDFHDFLDFFLGQSRTFPGYAEGPKAVNAVFELKTDKGSQPFLIEFEVLIERCHQESECTVEHERYLLWNQEFALVLELPHGNLYTI
jgi:hypothetical protein